MGLQDSVMQKKKNTYQRLLTDSTVLFLKNLDVCTSVNIKDLHFNNKQIVHDLYFQYHMLIAVKTNRLLVTAI